MHLKPKWPQVVAEFLIDNLTILLTIGFAGYILYRQEIAQLSLSTDDLLTAILGILALLATSEIVERYRKLTSIDKTVTRSLSLLESRLAEHPSAIAFFQKQTNLDHYIQGAYRIDLCGVTLTSTLNKQFGNLRERLEAGAKIRILIIDPDSTAIKMSAARSISADDTDYYRVRLDATLRDITYLHKMLEEVGKMPGNSQKAGEINVRLVSYAPSFSMLSFDPHQDNGIVFVEIYPHKMAHRLPPTFDLMPKRDGIWYLYFLDQFEEMWNAARPWEPQRSKQDPTL